MARTLVWMTHSFRDDSRLTSNLAGPCAFVYYSPYHFAGARERNIYQTCSQANLNAFYASINLFSDMLANKIQAKLHVYRTADPVAHINQLVADHGFDQLVIDQPLFAMWHTIDLSKIKCPVIIIDSDLIDHTCFKMTAKSRWTTHVDNFNKFQPHAFSPNIQAYNMPGGDKGYPVVPVNKRIDRPFVLKQVYSKIMDYKENRDRFDGQTGMSVALHNGIIDPANVFYDIAAKFQIEGFDITDLTGPAAAILRQQAFREISIIQARRANMTLENTPLEWAKALMHHAAYDNLINARPNPKGCVQAFALVTVTTGIKDLDFLLGKMEETGTMPNRARMYFASKVFYESKTGVGALEAMIAAFDLLGLDGQSPNNYTQCIGALGLSYGKVLKMNRDTAFQKLAY